MAASDPETVRLQEDARREKNWKRWGPYLSERQWGTVREDYSRGRRRLGATSRTTTPAAAPTAGARTACWASATASAGSASPSRSGTGAIPSSRSASSASPAPRGTTARTSRSTTSTSTPRRRTPTRKALYKYPQAEFPYARLVEENRRRGHGSSRSSSSLDTGVFDDDRYFDVFVEYAKAAPDDILIRITVANRGPEAARAARAADALVPQHLVAGGAPARATGQAARSARDGDGTLVARRIAGARPSSRSTPSADGAPPELLFTENETNAERLFGAPNAGALREGRLPRLRGRRRGRDAVNPDGDGTKAAAHYRARAARRAARSSLRLRLTVDGGSRRRAVRRRVRRGRSPARIAEADEFYAARIRPALADGGAARRPAGVRRAALVEAVLPLRRRATGSTATPASRRRPPSASTGRNADWRAPLQPRRHLDARQVGVPLVRRLGSRLPHDPVRRASIPSSPRSSSCCCCASGTCTPTGSSRRTSSRFGDVNPPVHAWACWRVYKMTAPARPARPAVPRARLPEAAAQLHLVGEPQGRGGQATCSPAASSGSTTSASSTARKPLPGGGHARAGRRHGLDGVLLHHHARDGARAGATTIPPTRTSPRSSSSTSSPSPTP